MKFLPYKIFQLYFPQARQLQLIKELLLDKDSTSDTKLVFDKLQQQINDTVQRTETTTCQQQGDLMNQR